MKYFILLLFISCTMSKPQLVMVKIVSQPMLTMKGYKYYVIYNNKFDSIYSNSNKYIENNLYPFYIKIK